MFDSKKLYEVCVFVNKHLFFHGHILKIDSDFIHFLDEVDGEILINKKAVVFIKEYKNIFRKLKDIKQSLKVSANGNRN